MPDDFDLEGWLASDLPARRSDFKIDLKAGIVETDGTPAEAEAALAMAKQMTALAQAQAQAQAAATFLPPAASAVVQGVSVRTAIEHWKTMDMPQLATSTQADYLATMESFAAHVGDQRLIASTAAPDVTHWVVHLKSTVGNVQSTAKKKGNAIISLFSSAMRAGFYPKGDNPGKVVRFTKTEQAERSETHGWQAFTPGQLYTLFTPDNLAKTREIHTRRAMVIALYTGARVGELAQLRVDGFGEAEGQKYLTLKGDLKTKASKRRIPLHPDLIELGVWNWMEDQKRRGFTRVFPTVKLDGKSGKGNAISKGCENLLKRLDIKPTIDKDLAETVELDPILGMHSFRDTIIQALQSAKINIELRKAYVGHAAENADKSDSHRVAYMRDWTPKEVADVFEGIEFGWWIDFPGLKTVLAQSDEEHARAMRTKEQREATRARTADIEAKRAADAQATAAKAAKRATRKQPPAEG